MKFLVIDDEAFKFENVKRYAGDVELDWKQSYNSGLRALFNPEAHYDGLVLDMQFPMFDRDWSSLKSDQGLGVLRELERKGIDLPVLVYSGNVFDYEQYPNFFAYVSTAYGDLERHLNLFKEKIKEKISA